MALRLVFLAVLLVVMSYSPILVDSQAWWSLGLTGCASGSICETCAALEERKILNPSQSESCSEDSSPIESIAKGTRQAIIECQKRFNGSRWNCTTFKGDALFGSFVSEKRTRETAVVYALLTAGATNAVARACQEQKLPTCPCIHDDRPSTDDDGNRILSDCSDNVEWALQYIFSFLNPSNVDEVGPASDQHNIQVGGNLIDSTEEFCRCHGLSGSCSVQTCYRRAPDVSQVGEELYIKYGGAVKVVLGESGLEGTNPSAAPLDDDDLTYVDNSPDFCVPDLATGVVGTAHRLCDPSPNSLNSCSVLCCGRGYYEAIRYEEIKKCEFKFCCEIVCSVVENRTITDHKCNAP